MFTSARSVQPQPPAASLNGRSYFRREYLALKGRPFPPVDSCNLHSIAENHRRGANQRYADLLLPGGPVQELGDAVDLIVVAIVREAQQLQQECVEPWGLVRH